MSTSDPLPVLLVDDDEGLTRTLRDILRLRGFAPETAMNGEGALDTLRRMNPQPAVAILDLRLPDMDGLDLAARLQSHARDLQVVILTGNASVETVLRAVRDQKCDYVVKPVHPEELIRTIRAAEGRWLLGRTEQELHSSRATLQAVFEASPLPVAVFAPDLAVRMWNRAAEDVFGWLAGEVLGRPAPAGLPEEEGLAARIVSTALSGERQTGLEFSCRRRDGSLLDVRVGVAALGDSSGRAEAILAIYEDITEQRRIAARLQQARRMDALGRLAGGVAHDFNNLLGVIRTETDLAMAGRSLPDDVRGTLGMISETAERGAALTRQLLAFARRQPMEETVVRLNEIVSGIERMLARLAGERVNVEIGLDGDAGTVKVDRGQLEQVLTNLVANARDAMPSGGRLEIRTGRERLTERDEPRGLEAGDWAMLSVTDTGTGIPEDVRSRIFEPFFTTKDEGSGTGLGLATSYSIVQGFGGQIVLDSEVGRGTSFRIFLPSAGEAAEARGTRRVQSPRGAEVVLLVEDHVALRASTVKILERQGYTVHAAGSGAEAWSCLEGLPAAPALAISDAHLPDGDGRDLLAAIRARYPAIRLLLTSGSFEVAGRDDLNVPFIGKPYTLDAIARAVREVLDAQ